MPRNKPKRKNTYYRPDPNPVSIADYGLTGERLPTGAGPAPGQAEVQIVDGRPTLVGAGGLPVSSGMQMPAGASPSSNMLLQPDRSGTSSASIKVATGPNAASRFIPRSEQLAAQEYLKNPKAAIARQQEQVNYLTNPEQVVNLIPDPVKSFMSRVFDTSDEADVFGESVFDGAMKGLNWGYDRLNQLTAAGISGLPGGMRTLSWDEAANVSVGQAFVGSMAAAAGRLERGELQVTDYPTILGVVASKVLSEFDPNNISQSENFDITDPVQRQAAFSDSTAGKWSSGLLDTAFMIADPLIGAGKAVKLARIRWVDRIIDTPEKLARAKEEMAYARTAINDAVARGATDDDISRLAMTPAAKFAWEATRRNADGSKRMSVIDIYNHRVIRRAANRDGIASALAAARDWDEADAIIRHAWGDLDATRQLAANRPAVLLEMLDSERDLIRMKLQVDPQSRATLIAQYRDEANKAAEELAVLERTNGTSIQKAFARERLDRANTLYMYAEEGEIPPIGVGPTATADELALAQRAFDEMKSGNEAFSRALMDETDRLSDTFGAFRNSTAGFSADNWFGRLVESSRERRARAATEYSMTKGVHWWEKETFYNTSRITRLGRAIQLWRWMGQEVPSGTIHTKGIGAQESARELIAVLNDVDIYSGNSKIVTRTRPVASRDADGKIIKDANGETVMTQEQYQVEIGGVAAKQRLVQEYMDALNMGGVQGDMDAKAIIDRIESQIAEDIASWHNVDRRIIEQVLFKSKKRLDEIQDSIKGKGYWVDDNGDINVSPFLESHLQDATFMVNWREFNKAAKIAGADSRLRGMREFGAEVSDFSKHYYGIFQDVWRPAVLLRLGYTQRNIAEGLFRASAFQFSLMPMVLAGRQLGYGARNTVAARRGRILGGEAIEAAKSGAPLPAKFVKWRDKQRIAVDGQIQSIRNAALQTRRQLAQQSDEFRVSEINRLNKRSAEILQENRDIRSNPVGPEQQEILDRNFSRVQEIYAEMRELRAIQSDGVDMTPEMLELSDDIVYFEETLLPHYQTLRSNLDDDLVAAVQYRKQAMAKRRVFDGYGDIPDPITVKNAFDKDSPFTSVALALLSADATTRATAALQVNTMTRAFRLMQSKAYQNVKPGDPGYWPGFATTLRQYQQSEIGKMIIQGRSADEIANYLISDPRGREISGFINGVGKMVMAPKRPRPYSVRLRKAEKQVQREAKPLVKAANAAKEELRQARYLARQARADLAARQAGSKRPLVQLQAGGKRWRNEEDLVAWLDEKIAARDAAVNKIDELLATVESKVKPNKTERTIVYTAMDREDALQYANEMIRRFDSLTDGNAELVKFLQTTLLPVGRRGRKSADEAADIVRRFMEAKDANGKPMYTLRPVIGNVDMDMGSKKVMDHVRSVTDKGFEWLGTMPEDFFVRAPFYGQRYQKVVADMKTAILAQTGRERLTMREINAIQRAAHRRSLKDTKDWLYTIDRRTNVGRYMEAIFPFVSASQNSITTVGRMIWNDPSIAVIMANIWNAPNRAGWEDEEGNIRIGMALEALPKSFVKAVGLDNMMDVTINKGQLNLILPDSGFGVVPRPGPLVAVPASEFMKHNLFGQTPYTPDILTNVMGKENADMVWGAYKDYVFGEERGPSASPLSIETLLPPAWQKAFQTWVMGEGSSSALTTWYNNMYESENAKYVAGYRDEPPTPEEIWDKTRNFQMFRMAMNFVAFTPPGYKSNMEPLTDAARKIDAEFGLEGSRLTADLFGTVLSANSKMAATESVGGVQASNEAVRLAQESESLIRRIAPGLEESGDLSALGLLVDSSDTLYDPSAQAWQLANNIPGTNRNWREVKNPEAARIDAQKQAFWIEFNRGQDVFEAALQQRGLKSFRSAAAESLRVQRDQWLSSLGANPMYAAGWDDYNNFAATRTNSAVKVITAAVSDSDFIERHKDSAVWQAGGIAEQYLNARNYLISQLALTGKGIDNADNKKYREWWDSIRMDFKNSSPEWAALANRYLNGDEDPERPSVIITPYAEASAFAVPDAGQGFVPAYLNEGSDMATMTGVEGGY